MTNWAYLKGELVSHNHVDKLVEVAFVSLKLPRTEDRFKIWLPEDIFGIKCCKKQFRVPDNFTYISHNVYKEKFINTLPGGGNDSAGSVVNMQNFPEHGTIIDIETGEMYVDLRVSHKVLMKEYVFDFDYFGREFYEFRGDLLDTPIPATSIPFTLKEIAIITHCSPSGNMGSPYYIQTNDNIINENFSLSIDSSFVSYKLFENPRKPVGGWNHD